mmetsp:Transcript_45413/g.119273  ORF Transcript_45413/g.119273 Transcript_45413/m.119273 type:complete len:84 (-) Transcript_45413:309-560(-)
MGDNAPDSSSSFSNKGSRQTGHVPPAFIWVTSSTADSSKVNKVPSPAAALSAAHLVHSASSLASSSSTRPRERGNFTHAGEQG